ncbi:hypothetical protein ACFO6R_16025 [Eubacterium multiforme]|uniref:Uncharacterized protein n=1 Tax=Eubacterium multiforme TaxID=83339 RepID=A0ABT9UTJ9_9FIRM|nr:hypothetical protein [Eubacterium multiforme]MDQ0149630.1 hypothetical protein [Eubacterium multiforme]
MSVENIKEKIEKFKNKRFKSQSAKYYLITVVMIFGLGFFLSSNYLLNKNFINVKSTELNQKMTLESVTIDLVSRKYNKDTGLFQAILYVSNDELNSDDSINVKVKVDTDPQKIIQSKLIKVSDNYYILTTNLKKNWNTVALVVSESNSNNENKNISIYNNKSDVVEDSKLKEENLNGYNVEITDLEIKDINNKIKYINGQIDTKKKLIMNLLSDNDKQKSDEKYQTEDEIKNTEGKITQNNNTIDNTKIDIENLLKSLEEQQKRIEKLQQKKSDLEK